MAVDRRTLEHGPHNVARFAIWTALVVLWLLIPLVSDRSVLNLLALSSVYAVAALGVAVLLGYAGIVSLAQSAFFAVGAFATSYVSVVLGLSTWLGLLLGAALAGIVAYSLGLAVLRLGGYFLALGTMALAIIAVVVINEAESITGGQLGIGGIPAPSIAGFEFNQPLTFYFLGWGVAFLAVHLVHNLLRSRHGLALRALRDHVDAALVLGVDATRLRRQVFVLSGVLGAVAGSLFASYSNYVSVSSFGVDKALVFVLMVVLGGARHIAGAVIGAIFVTIVPELVRGLGDFHQVVFGLVMVLVIVLAPNGLAGILTRAQRTGGVR